MLEIATAALGVAALVAAWFRRRRRRELHLLRSFMEQGRREHTHPVKANWRDDQRVLAIQQRLSRVIGKAAFSAKYERRIRRELGL